MSATASPKVDRTISLRDRRQLAYSEWGDLAGRPAFLLNGTPTSRLQCPDEAATELAGVRLITVDRPGYGRSDPRRGRKLLDFVDDFVELVDQLEVPSCPILGWSGGGPSAMALGFSLPDRVPVVGLAASPAPSEALPELLDVYSENGRASIALLRRDRAAGIAAFERDRAWFSGDGWESMLADSWGASDDRVLADPANLESFRTMFREAARQGSAGLVGDDVAEFGPWGFSVSDILQPVHIWCADLDTSVDQRNADYLARAIPHASLISYPGEGHLFPIQHWGEMLATLLR
jgi:pimeloyl-ACP methyl ester carboxylesterase